MIKLCTKQFSEFAVGERASFTVDITGDLVEKFAQLSGDQNPLHVDAAYAGATVFGSCIPHGMIAGMFFSRLIGMYLPGKHALYLSQTLKFHKPLPLGGVTVQGIIIAKNDALHVVTVETTVLDSQDSLLIDGQAVVKILL